MKKIYLVVEDSIKGKIVMPITKRDISGWYDFAFMLEETDRFYKTLKLNNDLETFYKLHKIGGKAIDAIYEGKIFILENKKLKPSKHKFWHSGKPIKWVKNP